MIYALHLAGLILFILVIVVDVLALLYDWYLKANNKTTLTYYARIYPDFRIAIYAWQVLGLLGLMVYVGTL